MEFKKEKTVEISILSRKREFKKEKIDKISILILAEVVQLNIMPWLI